MWAIVGLLLWPLVEIALFVTVGAELGLVMSLAIVLGSAGLGVALLRRAGLRASDGRRGLNLSQLARDGFVGMAAVLLILPGFLTDMLGVLLLLPPVQVLILRVVKRHIHPVTPPFDHPARQDEVIDGDWKVVDPKNQNAPPSGWTRH